ncbi:MAG TPA: DUF481 domain-containing protein [Pseudomonadales bacterium]|nr:DUF481 domain-containing protein [Pseudomonadales bacterium]
MNPIKVMLLILGCLTASLVHGEDYVVMKNGDRITGELKKIWNEEVFIEPAYGDEYAIELDAVAYVHSDEPFEVAYRVGRRTESLVGHLAVDADKRPIVVADDGRSMPLRAIDNLTEVEDYRDWSVRTDLSANLSRGNTDTSNARVYAIGDLKLGEHRHRLELTQDTQRTEGTSTKEQTEVAYQDMWTFTDDWFVRGAVNWTRDPIRELDARTRVSLGPGYHFWDDSKRTLNLSISPNWVVENIDGSRDESLAVQAALRYEQKFMRDELILFLNADFSRVVDGRDNETFESTVGFRFDVTDDIYLNMQIEQNHESNPASAISRSDVTYLIGAGMELD